MKKLAVLLSIFLLIPAVVLGAGEKTKVVDRLDQPSFLGWMPGQLIVKFQVPSETLQSAKRSAGVVSLGISSLDGLAERFKVSEMQPLFAGAKPQLVKGKPFDLSRHYLVRFDQNADLDEVAAAYGSDPNVESVEKDGIHSLYATPNDGYYSYQWHLNQANDHDIDAPEGWDLETGSTSVIIALLDSGTRYYHPDLGGANASVSNPGASRGNMWINNAELNGTSGVDDDGNGYVDDWIGWDFITGVSNCWSGEDCSTPDNDPRDFNGHGTHTAGIMGMLSNDGYGMCGVAGGWHSGTQPVTGNGVKIMPLRMGYSYNYLGQEYGVVIMSAAASAFYYAGAKGAKIASCSWGSSNSGGIAAAADYFIAQGGIIFVAAGNDGSQTADYLNGRGDCVSVAATNESDNACDFTTYGTWVDISAPGNNIYSTYHDHTDANTIYWAAMSGTSMATPMTAATAALIWSHNLSWTATQVKSQLYSSADNIDAYLSSTYIGKMGAGRINVYNAVNTGPTPPVANFSGTPTSGYAPLAVTFTDLSSGSPTSWSWTFGDGGTSASQNPSHTYTSAGSYTVTLTVTNAAGSDGETKTGYITVSNPPTYPPVANFSGTPTSGTAPLVVAFTDLSTNSPTSWAWTFGDGGTSTAQNPSHTYTAAGTYTVALTATNAYGSDLETKTGYITVTETSEDCDDFNDGNYTGWYDAYGTWSAAAYYLSGNSNTTNARLISPFGTFSTVTVNCNVRMNTGRTQRKARIIVAYANSSNYRYVEFDDVANRVNIGEILNGRAYTRAYASYTFNYATWYAVKVTVSSTGTVTGYVGSTAVKSYAFSSRTGAVGVGFTKSVSDFDDFCVTSTMSSWSERDENPITLPNQFSLDQNYPNPFNPTTTIEFNLPTPSQVEITVYNITGQTVGVIADGYYPAGNHRVDWDAGKLASGVYLYRISAGDFTATKKMILLK